MTAQPIEQTFSPYSTAVPYGSAPATWMDEYDAQRTMSYQVYEQMYWNVEKTFEVSARGSENSPIYVPTPRTIVETINRYVCPSPGYVIDPYTGNPAEQDLARRVWSATFTRERFWSKFLSAKRFGIIRGDWAFHVIGNPAKPQGSRIKIEAIDPGMYFPVTHPNDDDKIIAVHLVYQLVMPDGNVVVKRQTYTKGRDPILNDGSDTTIWNSVGLYDLKEWDALDASAIQILVPPTPLPPAITAIPVFHIRNFETPGDPFGSSELRGYERVFAAINQVISDEELALALDGLGLYATDGGPPRDEDGNLTDWVLGPGRVVEHPAGSKFERVTGVASVSPFQEHYNTLVNSLRESKGISNAAIGSVKEADVSGISLYLQLAPILATADERNDGVKDIMDQMFFVTTQFFAAYEQFNTPVRIHPAWGSAVPVDPRAQAKEILAIVGAGLADEEWGRTELSKLGYVFPADAGEAVLRSSAAKAAATDPFAMRAMSDLEG